MFYAGSIGIFLRDVYSVLGYISSYNFKAYTFLRFIFQRPAFHKKHLLVITHNMHKPIIHTKQARMFISS